MRSRELCRASLVGLLVVAAISLAAGSGRRLATQNPSASIRMLTDSEAIQIGKAHPGLWVRSQVRSELLERLFPHTAFYKALHGGGTPRFPYMVCISGNSVFELPSDFNSLLRELGMKVADNNIVDLAKAFTIVALGGEPIVDTITGEYAGIESIPQVIFLGGQRIEQRDSSNPNAIDARITCRVGSETQSWEFFELRHMLSKGKWTKAGQFGVVHLIINGKPVREYVPLDAE